MSVSYEELGESLVGWSQLGNLKLVKNWAERARIDLDFQSGIFLEFPFDFSDSLENGMTSLIGAIVNGHYEVVEWLLQSGRVYFRRILTFFFFFTW